MLDDGINRGFCFVDLLYQFLAVLPSVSTRKAWRSDDDTGRTVLFGFGATFEAKVATWFLGGQIRILRAKWLFLKELSPVGERMHKRLRLIVLKC